MLLNDGREVMSLASPGRFTQDVAAEVEKFGPGWEVIRGVGNEVEQCSK